MRKLNIFLVLLLILLSGCSVFASRGTPAAHQTVVSVATQYLGYIVLNDKNKVDGMVLWLDYIDKSDGTLSKEYCFKQMDVIAKKYSKDNHPLVKLSLIDVEVRGNNAGIILENKNMPNLSEIEISMRWIGNGWLIIKDNIFGEDGVLAESLQS